MRVSGPPTSITLPDYAGGSIVNLMASIAAALGASHWPYPLLRLLEPALLGGRSHILLLVLDGLGYRYLCEARPTSSLRQHLCGCITSVFPSTTATAVTALMTGLPPQQHGLTGWHVYFEEIDAVGTVLPFRVRPTDEPLTQRGLQPAEVFDYPAFFDRVPVRTFVVSPSDILNSEYNTAHSGRAERCGYGSIAQSFEVIETCLRGAGERKFVYAYYPHLDSSAHQHGIGARHTTEVFRRLEAAVGRLLRALAGADVTVLITADHGFIDAPQERRVELDDHPRLAATLARPLCGERRVAYCYVRPGQERAFEEYVRDELSDRALLYASPRLMQEGWFGPGVPHPKLASRIGDYVLVMTDRATIKDWMPGEKRHQLIGVHGGVTEEEMLVPLAVIQP
jgi:hypothetical protein